MGEGYAQSTPGEIAAIAAIARQTGVVLDPVYTLKAVLGMVRDLESRRAAPREAAARSPEQRGGGGGGDAAARVGAQSGMDPSRASPTRRVLFIHTGGLLGLFDKSKSDAVEAELSGERNWQQYRTT